MLHKKYRFEIYTRFNLKELQALRAFYGGTPARKIRTQTGIDPWPVLSRHRHLSKHLYEAVKWELISIDPPEMTDIKPKHQRAVPRWRRCPHCLQWKEPHDWREGRYADAIIGHRKSGCHDCFQKAVARYKATRKVH